MCASPPGCAACCTPGARDRQAAVLSGRHLADLFWAVSFVLPVGTNLGGEAEREAHEDAVRNAGPFGVHQSGVASGDADSVERLLAADPSVGRQFSGGRLFLASLLDVADGARAGEILSRTAPPPQVVEDWAGLLALVDHDGARARLADLRDAGCACRPPIGSPRRPYRRERQSPISRRRRHTRCYVSLPRRSRRRRTGGRPSAPRPRR